MASPRPTQSDLIPPGGQTGARDSETYHVLTPVNSAIGPNALVINHIDTLPLQWKRPMEVPNDLQEGAIGREVELKLLHAYLQAGDSTAVVGKSMSASVQGLPGVGKSTLAALYARRFGSYYAGGILWLKLGPEARDEESVNPELNRIAAYAYNADAQVLLAGKQLSAELVRMLLEHHGPILIVADDAWSQEVLGPLRRALPAEGRLLVTTRDIRVANQLGRKLALDVLSEEDASFLIRQKLPALPVEWVERLSRAVGRHPLALDVALGDLAARSEGAWTVSTELIERTKRSVAQGEGLGDLPLMDESDRDSRVEAALRTSYLALAPELQRRFRALGCMAQEADFDTGAAAIWGDPEHARASEYLHTLAARALLKRQGDRWQQHAILRAYALNLQSAEERESLRRRHALHYTAVAASCYEHKPRDYDRLERDFSQIQHAFAWLQANEPKPLITLVHVCKDFMHIRGRLGSLLAWLGAALRATDQSDDRVGKANTLRSLGDLESRLGNVEQARRRYEEALPLYEAEQARLGKANTLRGLGDLEGRLGNVEQARRRYEEALPLYEAVQGRLGKANTLKSLGDLERRLGNVERARRGYEEALPLYEAEQARLGKANTLRSLGDLKKRLGNVEQARRRYEEALPLYEAEQNRLGKANTLVSLGDLESRLENVEQARRKYEEALPLYEAEQDRLGKANTLRSLGDLGSRLRNVEQARRKYEEALPLYEAEQDRLGKANTLRSLGDLESRLGNVEQARRKYEEALPLYEAEQNRLGKANTLVSLGNLESRLGNVEQARRKYEGALPLHEAEQDPIGKMNILLSLARLEWSERNLPLAGEHYRQVLELAECLPGFNKHPVTRGVRLEYQKLLAEMQEDPSRE